MRTGLLLSLGLCLLACNGGDIAVFSAQAGASAPGGEAGVGGGGAENGGSSPAAGASEAGWAGIGASGSNAGQTNEAGAGTGAQAGSGDTPCHDNADCPSTFYCSKPACSEPQGICLPRPFPDDGMQAPVCGCDHVTYWNDTLRERYGVAASTPGECMMGARHCDHDKDCGVFDARCQHLLPPDQACGSALGPGTCWVTPIDCPPSANAEFQMCPPAGGGAGGAMPCITQCQAVQSGHPFIQVARASCP